MRSNTRAMVMLQLIKCHDVLATQNTTSSTYHATAHQPRGQITGAMLMHTDCWPLLLIAHSINVAGQSPLMRPEDRECVQIVRRHVEHISESQVPEGVRVNAKARKRDQTHDLANMYCTARDEVR